MELFVFVGIFLVCVLFLFVLELVIFFGGIILIFVVLCVFVVIILLFFVGM